MTISADTYFDEVLAPLVGMHGGKVLDGLAQRPELHMACLYHDNTARRGLDAGVLLLARWLEHWEWYELTIGDGWIQRAAYCCDKYNGRPHYMMKGQTTLILNGK